MKLLIRIAIAILLVFVAYIALSIWIQSKSCDWGIIENCTVVIAG